MSSQPISQYVEMPVKIQLQIWKEAFPTYEDRVWQVDCFSQFFLHPRRQHQVYDLRLPWPRVVTERRCIVYVATLKFKEIFDGLLSLMHACRLARLAVLETWREMVVRNEQGYNTDYHLQIREVLLDMLQRMMEDVKQDFEN